MTTATMTDRERALESLSRLAPWRADDRQSWLRVGMALQSVSDDLYSDWDQWSRQSEKYDPKVMRTTWRSFHAGDGITLGSLITWANEDDPAGAGSRPAPRPFPRPVLSSNGHKPKAIYPTPEAAVQDLERQTGGTYEAHWCYQDGGGAEVLRVERLLVPPRPGKKPKTYRPLHPVGDGWALGDPPGPLPLFNLPAVLQADAVAVFEGEKLCDLAAGIGLVATTSAHGAQSAKRTDWAPLAGKSITIYPDCDREGERYAQDVARILATLDPPAEVRIVDLPVGEGEDLEQWLEGYDSQEPEQVRAILEALPARQSPVTARPAAGPDEVDDAVPQYVAASSLVEQYKSLRDPVIHGILRRGEVGNVVSSSKARKTWLMNGLAVDYVTAGTWLGRFQTAGGRVLVIDFELHRETMAKRLRDILTARGLPSSTLDDIQIEALRGRNADTGWLIRYANHIGPGVFDLNKTT